MLEIGSGVRIKDMCRGGETGSYLGSRSGSGSGLGVEVMVTFSFRVGIGPMPVLKH